MVRSEALPALGKPAALRRYTQDNVGSQRPSNALAACAIIASSAILAILAKPGKICP